MENTEENRQQDGHGTKEDSPLRLAEDQFYRALAVSERRRLLYYLSVENESTIEELATVLSGWEATTTGTMYTSADRSDVYLTLVHNHLPRLAEAGLIDYDSSDESVQIASLHPRVIDIIRESIEAEQHTEA